MNGRAGTSLPPRYFDDLYAHDPDPWQFETSAYEAAKYDATLDALPIERFASALEVGCSIGVLTARLAPRCDELLAIGTISTTSPPASASRWFPVGPS